MNHQPATNAESQDSAGRGLFSLELAAIIAVHLAFVVPFAWILNIWSDEASTLYSTEHGFFRTLNGVLHDEKQAPLYFLVLSLWRDISSSVFFARIFSILLSVAAIVLFLKLSSRLFSRRTALLLTAFFGVHPFLIWASLEIRVYSAVILFSVAVLTLFYDGYLQATEPSDSRNKVRIAYTVIAVAAIYTNYYLGFLLVGNFAALLAVGRWRAARSYLVSMIAVGVAILPLVWMIKLQLGAVANDVQAARELGEGVRLIWNSLLNFAVPTELFPPDEITTISFIRLWVVRAAIVFAAVVIVFRRRIADKNVLALGAVCSVILVFLLISYFLLGSIYVEIRHAAVLFPPFVLLTALIIREILEPWTTISGTKPLAMIAAGAIVLSIFGYSIFSLYPNSAKRGDWRRVAAYLDERERAGQPIIVFPAYDVLNLPYNYKGKNSVFPKERIFNWGYEAEHGSADSQKSEIAFIISNFPPDAEEVWLVTSDFCELTKTCEPLDKFVGANYTIVEEKYFFQERVRLLRKRPK